MSKVRYSNFELLRIISILMVFYIHCNYWSLGVVNSEVIHEQPIVSGFRIFLQQLCACGVNAFVLISGWFGIKATYKGICKLLFQICFWGGGGFLLAFFLYEPIRLSDIFKVFWFGGCYWFVMNYVVLYVMSPILNSYIQTTSPKQLLTILLLFFVTEFAYGWIYPIGPWAYGYSVISFVGLYLLASYIRLYSKRVISLQSGICFSFFLLSIFIPSSIEYSGMWVFGKDFRMIAYSSPFVIISSVLLLLSFCRIKLQSKLINNIAVSVLPLYLLQCHPAIETFFQKKMNSFFMAFGPSKYLFFSLFFGVSALIFVVVLDKARLIIWNYSSSLILKKSN